MKRAPGADGAGEGLRFALARARLEAVLGRPGMALNVGQAGCGSGAQCRLWSGCGHQVYGVDSDPAAIAAARARARLAGLEILFDLAGAARLPWPDRSMDLCLAGPPPRRAGSWQPCLDELLRVLRPGGVLYLSGAGRRSGPRQRLLWLRLRRQLARRRIASMDRLDLAALAPRSRTVRGAATLAGPVPPLRGCTNLILGEPVLLAFKP